MREARARSARLRSARTSARLRPPRRRPPARQLRAPSLSTTPDRPSQAVPYGVAYPRASCRFLMSFLIFQISISASARLSAASSDIAPAARTAPTFRQATLRRPKRRGLARVPCRPAARALRVQPPRHDSHRPPQRRADADRGGSWTLRTCVSQLPHGTVRFAGRARSTGQNRRSGPDQIVQGSIRRVQAWYFTLA